MAMSLPDSRPMKAECKVQLRFSKTLFLQSLTIIGLIALMQVWLARAPDRRELGERAASLVFSPVRLAPSGFAPLRLVGAWTVRSDDPRFGGISALAVDGEALIALTDSGVVIRFARPGSGRAAASIRELPGGPGNPAFKYNRDSEALLRDPRGRGWWVAFENRNQLWLYDRGFDQALGRIDFGRGRWRKNVGIEGLAADGRDLSLFPEAGQTLVRISGERARTQPIERPAGRISDSARVPGGGLIVVHRHWSLLGFTNAISLLEPAAGGGLKVARSLPLRVGRLDNVEALAAQPLAGGGTRLWLMTDDNFQPPLRTLLIALDVPQDFGG